MNTFFNEDGTLNIEDIIIKQPSFLKIIEDGKVTADEVRQQSRRVKDLLNSIAATASPEQIDKIRELLAEISVLIVAGNIHEEQNETIQ